MPLFDFFFVSYYYYFRKTDNARLSALFVMSILYFFCFLLIEKVVNYFIEVDFFFYTKNKILGIITLITFCLITHLLHPKNRLKKSYDIFLKYPKTKRLIILVISYLLFLLLGVINAIFLVK